MENNVIKQQKPIITYSLITINIIMWALISLYSFKTGRSYNELLNVFGAKVNVNIMQGQYWRFITPIFLHANITHLLVNCYSLHAVGGIVEKIFGHSKFLVVYLAAGIMGNILSFMFSINPAVGASGAIFGLLGALLYFGIEQPMLFKAIFGNRVLIIIAINLAYGFLNTGIDNYGHIGGLIGGFLVLGIVKAPINTKWYRSKITFIVFTLVIVISGLVYGFNNSSNNVLLNLEELYRHDRNQNWEEAARIGQDTLKLKPSNESINIEVLWITAKAEAVTNNYDKAVEHAKMLAELSPEDGYYLLGVIYYDTEQFDLSKEALLKAKDMDSQYSNIDELLNNIEVDGEYDGCLY